MWIWIDRKIDVNVDYDSRTSVFKFKFAFTNAFLGLKKSITIFGFFCIRPYIIIKDYQRLCSSSLCQSHTLPDLRIHFQFSPITFRLCYRRIWKYIVLNLLLMYSFETFRSALIWPLEARGLEIKSCLTKSGAENQGEMNHSLTSQRATKYNPWILNLMTMKN